MIPAKFMFNYLPFLFIYPLKYLHIFLCVVHTEYIRTHQNNYVLKNINKPFDDALSTIVKMIYFFFRFLLVYHFNDLFYGVVFNLFFWLLVWCCV